MKIKEMKTRVNKVNCSVQFDMAMDVVASYPELAGRIAFNEESEARGRIAVSDQNYLVQIRILDFKDDGAEIVKDSSITRISRKDNMIEIVKDSSITALSDKLNQIEIVKDSSITAFLYVAGKTFVVNIGIQPEWKVPLEIVKDSSITFLKEKKEGHNVISMMAGGIYFVVTVDIGIGLEKGSGISVLLEEKGCGCCAVMVVDRVVFNIHVEYAGDEDELKISRKAADFPKAA